LDYLTAEVDHLTKPEQNITTEDEASIATKGVMVVYRTLTFEVLYKQEVDADVMKYPKYSDPFEVQAMNSDPWIKHANVFMISNDNHALIALNLGSYLTFTQLEITTPWSKPESKEIYGELGNYLEFQDDFIFEKYSYSKSVVFDLRRILEDDLTVNKLESKFKSSCLSRHSKFDVSLETKNKWQRTPCFD
jgi:hypothetical protein